mmetsp:Transcript_31252/g.75548  ORF Transcript_31252/g.75548 Transcript_31252/m.75548 type:complete len:357 (+) Transcript_31252:254-1324(+)
MSSSLSSPSRPAYHAKNGGGVRVEDFPVTMADSMKKYRAGEKTGHFTAEETEMIKQAVQKYCAAKGVSVERLCSECQHKCDLKGAWMEIAKDIPHRSVQSVYRHGLRQLHPFKRGKWTEAEVEQLMHHVDLDGKKWATIQDKLNRSADACRDKYREQCEDFNRGRWTDEETEELKKQVRLHLKVDADMDMKDLAVMVKAKDITIPWNAIQKKMSKRSRLSCYKKWEKMAGISRTRYSASKDGKKKKKAKDAAGATGPGGEVKIEEAPKDPIIVLLLALTNSGAKKLADVDWDGIEGVEDAEEKWSELFEEFQESTTDEDILTLPLAELAKTILDQKSSTKQAEDTVEAVLPASMDV